MAKKKASKKKKTDRPLSETTKERSDRLKAGAGEGCLRQNG